MSDDVVVTVESAADVDSAARDLNTRDSETICTLLEDVVDGSDGITDGEERLVFWYPDWLAAEKELIAAEGSHRVAVAWLAHETDNAWGVSQTPPDSRDQNADLVFLPKSVARAFRRGRVESLIRPQAGLDQFAGGESS